MATGAVVRCLAPLLNDKLEGTAGRCRFRRWQLQLFLFLAAIMGLTKLPVFWLKISVANAAITTSGDVNFGVALDEPPEGYVLVNPERMPNQSWPNCLRAKVLC